ncbi:MAG: SH3 domain-containing protein [Thiolinea sp.]
MKIATYVKSTLAASTLFLALSSLPLTAHAESEFYQVTNVESDDSLNIRSGAGTSYPVIGTIPFNGRTVMTTGQTRQVGSSTWTEVVWLGQIGWVNQRYLTDSEQMYTQPSQQTQVSASQNDANSHTHPANRCTRSVTHSHPNGANPHKHHYSCDPNTQQQPPVKNNQTTYPAVSDPNSHTHPANRCTRSVTHSHPNGAGPHQHHYSCDPRQSNTRAKQPARQAASDPNAHTHPRNECTNSVTHSHPNGARAHQHHYSCQPNANPKYRPQASTNDYYAIQ